ncbi:MAG: outer membrane lipoprotein-sorting protein [Bdellovibrionaceae bacterium]|nr:outer membrane lipoprotein-sorting protein [Pseudobdellovibrionaceae bacterium]
MKAKWVLFTLMATTNIFAAPTAGQILKEAEKYRALDEAYTVSVKVTNRTGAVVQDETEFKVYIKDNNTSLVEQTSPASGRGRKLLMIGNDLWLRTNDIKKAIRISLDQKLTGETANGDLSKTNFYADYEPKIVEEAKTFYKLHLKSKHDSTTYQQINYFIHKKGHIPFKAEFMAMSGKILKTMEYAKPDKKIKNQTLISKVRITDAIVKERSSVLVYSQFKPQNIDDSIFNRASM